MRDTVLPPGAHYTVHEAVVAQPLGDEMILLNLDCGMYYGLNGVGRSIWTSIAQGASPDEVVATLMAEYDVTRDTATRGVAAFLHDLARAGLVSAR